MYVIPLFSLGKFIFWSLSCGIYSSCIFLCFLFFSIYFLLIYFCFFYIFFYCHHFIFDIVDSVKIFFWFLHFLSYIFPFNLICDVFAKFSVSCYWNKYFSFVTSFFLYVFSFILSQSFLDSLWFFLLLFPLSYFLPLINNVSQYLMRNLSPFEKAEQQAFFINNIMKN